MAVIIQNSAATADVFPHMHTTTLSQQVPLKQQVPPLTPRRSPRKITQSVVPVAAYSALLPLNAGSSKRKIPDSPPETPCRPKDRRITQPTSASSSTDGSGRSLEEIDPTPATLEQTAKKLKKAAKIGEDAKAKKALWFKLDEGYWYTAWPVMGTPDAAACVIPQHRKPRDITPIGLEQFDLQSILQSKFFQNDFNFIGAQDLLKAYQWIAPLTCGKSNWNDGVAALVFLACQIFLPRELFDAEVVDDKGQIKRITGSLYFYGAPLSRNYIIAAIISLSTGIYFTNKNVSSYMQSLEKTIKKAVDQTGDGEARAEAEEVWKSWQHGSPLARNAMQNHIDLVLAARLKSRSAGGDAVKIALSLHPMLAFFIGRNGGILPGQAKPVNQLIDVSNHKTHQLPYPFAWGWYFATRKEGVPGGVAKRPYPFGTPDQPSPSCLYMSSDDVEKSGKPEELDADIEGEVEAGDSH